MTWRNVLHRTSLILGLISLGLALWAGVHLQHLLDDEGNRHAGETVVALVNSVAGVSGGLVWGSP